MTVSHNIDDISTMYYMGWLIVLKETETIIIFPWR